MNNSHSKDQMKELHIPAEIAAQRMKPKYFEIEEERIGSSRICLPNLDNNHTGIICLIKLFWNSEVS